MFGIHVNTTTVVTFLDIGTCTTCFTRGPWYQLRTIHTLRTQRQERQHDSRTYNSGAKD